MKVDGYLTQNKIFGRIRKEVSACSEVPTLHIIYVGEDETIAKYVALKEEKSGEVGIRAKVWRFKSSISQDQLVEKLKDIIANQSGGVIIQLPLPPHINKQKILDLVPVDRDIDVLSSSARERLKMANTNLCRQLLEQLVRLLMSMKLN